MNIRKLTAADIPFGLRLSAQNHWNQLEDDWRRQLDLEPDGCFLAENAGTACCCVFDQVAWINLVLVDLPQRGRGVGTALMRHVIDDLDKRGMESIRLDATPLGQPVYEKLGFVGDFTLTRFEGTFSSTTNDVPGVEPLTRTDLGSVCDLDEAVTQTKREKLLRHVFEATPDAMRNSRRTALSKVTAWPVPARTPGKWGRFKGRPRQVTRCSLRRPGASPNSAFTSMCRPITRRRSPWSRRSA